MSSKTPKETNIQIDRVFLDLKNPRHEQLKNESQIIQTLLKDELVYNLAADIRKNGLNPLERFGVFRIKGSSNKDDEASFTVVEGNRRLCALKLLSDPDLAPSSHKERFTKLAKGWVQPDTIPVTIFSSRTSAKPWLERIHTGTLKGIGRKSWDSDQTQRFSGGNKNALSLSVLDYAQKKGMVSAEDRKSLLTTVQRFLSNPIFRNTLGIELKLDENRNFVATKDSHEFDSFLEMFLRELIDGTIESILQKRPSRTKAADIWQYAKHLEDNVVLNEDKEENSDEKNDEQLNIPEVEEEHDAEPEETDDEDNVEDFDEDPPEPPSKPQKQNRIKSSQVLNQKLTELDNYKLSSLYYSMCVTQLGNHTPMVSICVWSFIESLTAMMGRVQTTAFSDFLSKNKLSNMGIGSGKALNQYIEAIGRIHKHGNTTKHSQTAANFDSQQLVNDVETLKPVLIACMEDAIAQISN